MLRLFFSSLRILIPFLYFGLLTGKAHAQNTYVLDSLKKQLENYDEAKKASGNSAFTLADSTRAKILISLSKVYNGNDFEKSIDYATKSLTLSKEIGFQKGVGNGYNGIGSSYFSAGTFDSALAYFQKALEVRIEIDDKKTIGPSYNNIGAVYDTKGNYPEALKYYLLALKMNEQFGKKISIANNADNIGNIYATMKNFNDAQSMLTRAKKIYEEEKDTQGLAKVHLNIGNAYFDQGNSELAIKNWTQCLEFSEANDDRATIASVLNSLGDAYKEQAKYDTALRYYQQSYQIADEIGDMYRKVVAAAGIGAVYETLGDLPQAIQYLNEAIEEAKASGFQRELAKGYWILSVAYEKSGKYREAYENEKLNQRLSDSLFNSENTEQLTRMSMQYEFDKKEAATKAENEKKQLRLQAEKNRFIISSVALGIILSLLVIIFYINRKRKATVYQQNLADSEMKALRAQMNPHFIFNSLNAIQQMVLNNENENAFTYLDSYSKLTRSILENSEKKWIPLQDEIKFLDLYLQIESLRFDHAFTYSIVTAENISVHEDHIPALIIQPLVENAIKHGLLNKDGEKKLLISFSKQNEKQLQVIVEDNGIGRAAATNNNEDHQSMSLSITGNRLRLLDTSGQSTISFEDIQDQQGIISGTRVIVTITQPG